MKRIASRHQSQPHSDIFEMSPDESATGLYVAFAFCSLVSALGGFALANKMESKTCSGGYNAQTFRDLEHEVKDADAIQKFKNVAQGKLDHVKGWQSSAGEVDKITHLKTHTDFQDTEIDAIKDLLVKLEKGQHNIIKKLKNQSL